VLQPLQWESGESKVPYVADDDHQVDVRYAPCVAPWIVEQTGKAPEADGSVVVTHRVADPRWLVRHVLQYAGDATVEDPHYRGMVREAAERLTV
jgi:predicted DNA-binding transcriptional regulator YafY